MLPPAVHFSRVWRTMAVLHAFVLGRGAIIKGGRRAWLWGKVMGRLYFRMLSFLRVEDEMIYIF